GQFEGTALRGEWEMQFLSLLKLLCTSDRLPQDLRDEFFTKVERLFMAGLRSSSPQSREEFFSMYHTHVPPTLYDRFHFVFMAQDWEAMASQFWLKQALDLILSILKDEERIMLAPNSAQIPPLIAGTRQNVFNPSAQQQQRQQPPPTPAPAAPAAAAGAAAAAAAAAAGAPVPGQGPPHGAPPGMPPGAPPGVPPGAALGVPLGAALGVPQVAPLSGVPVMKAEPGTEDGAAMDVKVEDFKTEDGAFKDEPMADAGGAGVSMKVPARGRFPVGDQVLDMLTRHAEFLSTAGGLRVSDMMGALREYATVDPGVAHHLWVLVFPIVWATLEKPQQIHLAKPIITLLSKEYHQRQAMVRPNVVQALLEGISLSQPQPKIPPELIKYLGKTFNAWNIAIPLLESHVVIFPDETRCLDSLLDLYRGVAEDDVMYGLWRRRCHSDLTRTCLTLVQAGQWERGEDLLGEAVRQGQVGAIQAGRGENALWVEQWLNASRQLGRWDTLMEYARATENHEIGVDCLWRLSDWPTLKDTLHNKAQVEEGVSTLMTRAYLALQEGDVNSGDMRTAQAMDAALRKWWQLPSVGCTPQLPLLQVFQQLVELKESVRIMYDLANGNRVTNHPFRLTSTVVEISLRGSTRV
ncbi:hypothetical protein FOA52_003153, partial [Chlamydomonas sp. UWO 241]